MKKIKNKTRKEREQNRKIETNETEHTLICCHKSFLMNYATFQLNDLLTILNICLVILKWSIFFFYLFLQFSISCIRFATAIRNAFNLFKTIFKKSLPK